VAQRCQAQRCQARPPAASCPSPPAPPLRNGSARRRRGRAARPAAVRPGARPLRGAAAAAGRGPPRHLRGHVLRAGQRGRCSRGAGTRGGRGRGGGTGGGGAWAGCRAGLGLHITGSAAALGQGRGQGRGQGLLMAPKRLAASPPHLITPCLCPALPCQMVDILAQSLSLAETPVPLKIARLFLASDILHNSTAPGGRTAQRQARHCCAAAPALRSRLGPGCPGQTPSLHRPTPSTPARPPCSAQRKPLPLQAAGGAARRV
jgi:hypothetical protein